jgi:hypothetical protein
MEEEWYAHMSRQDDRIRELEAALEGERVARRVTEAAFTVAMKNRAQLMAERDEAVRLVGDMYRATDIKSPTVEEFLDRIGAGK